MLDEELHHLTQIFHQHHHGHQVYPAAGSRSLLAVAALTAGPGTSSSSRARAKSCVPPCIISFETLSADPESAQRLAKWFTTLSPKDKAKIIKDVSQLVLARRTRMCNFLEYKGSLSLTMVTHPLGLPSGGALMFPQPHLRPPFCCAF